MKFSDILALAALFSSASAIPAPQACDDACNCFNDFTILKFKTSEACVTWAKANDYPEWLGKRENSLSTRQESDDCLDACSACSNFSGFASEQDCINGSQLQDHNNGPFNSDEDYNYSSESISERAGSCDNNPDLCLTFSATEDVGTSFPVMFDKDVTLGAFTIGDSSHVRVNSNTVYDLTRCTFTGSNPDIISQRPAVHLQEDSDDVYDIGPPQILQMVHCPSPTTS